MKNSRNGLSGYRLISLAMAFLLMVISAMPVFAQETGQSANADPKTAQAATSSATPKKPSAAKPKYNKKNAKKWRRVGKHWVYHNKIGKPIKKVPLNTKSKWVKAGGKTFYFGKNKYPVYNCFYMINGKLYYFGADRAKVIGKVKGPDGKIYKTSKNGHINGPLYYVYKYKNLVHVDISDQKVRFYKNRKLVRTAPVITGRKSRGWDTPTGLYRIGYRVRNTWLNGSSHVDYWMAFIGNMYGFHDAWRWRSDKEFKNKKRYLQHGSHGCINMLRKDAKWMYYNVGNGTKVYICK